MKTSRISQDKPHSARLTPIENPERTSSSLSREEAVAIRPSREASTASSSSYELKSIGRPSSSRDQTVDAASTLSVRPILASPTQIEQDPKT